MERKGVMMWDLCDLGKTPPEVAALRGSRIAGKQQWGAGNMSQGTASLSAKPSSHASWETACPRCDFSHHQPAPGEGEGARRRRCCEEGRLEAAAAPGCREARPCPSPLPGPAAPGSETAWRVACCPSLSTETTRPGSSRKSQLNSWQNLATKAGDVCNAAACQLAGVMALQPPLPIGAVLLLHTPHSRGVAGAGVHAG